jgi:aromatic-L-amino-acid decarboxylase
MTPEEFRRAGHDLIDWIADDLAHPERRPVVPHVAPGELVDKLPASAPDAGESPETILKDFERLVLPHTVGWNHPGFMAYFAAGGSPDGALAEALMASLNNVGLLWKASPALVELEQVSLGWLAEWLNLPADWFGMMHTTASEASLHAVIGAREALAARQSIDLNKLVMYTSEHAHSSIEKSMMALGQGRDACRKIATDEAFRMRPDALEEAVRHDLAAGLQPIAVCATIGTTSVSSVDPVTAIADIAERYDLWLHVDAAYAGPCAMLPEHAEHFRGVERADSFLVNPHKWMFSPMGVTAFYTRRPEALRRGLSLTPEYLRSQQDPRAVNLMEYAIPLGRPMRGLKLWYLMRSLGKAGYQRILRAHLAWAQWLAAQVDADADFERMAPAPFSLVCLRARPAGVPEAALDAFNERLLEAVNASGEFFLSHTELNGRFTIRVAIGNLRTTENDVHRLWRLLQAEATRLATA